MLDMPDCHTSHHIDHSIQHTPVGLSSSHCACGHRLSHATHWRPAGTAACQHWACCEMQGRLHSQDNTHHDTHQRGACWPACQPLHQLQLLSPPPYHHRSRPGVKNDSHHPPTRNQQQLGQPAELQAGGHACTRHCHFGLLACFPTPAPTAAAFPLPCPLPQSTPHHGCFRSNFEHSKSLRLLENLSP
jgi:hypothetical protein